MLNLSLKRIILVVLLVLGVFSVFGDITFADHRLFHSGDGFSNIDCGDSNDCIRHGVEEIGPELGGGSINTEQGIADAIQDLIARFLTYITIIAVVYVIGAGAYLIFFSFSEESSKKTRQVILYVVIGILVIWLAYVFVTFIISVLSGDGDGSGEGDSSGFFLSQSVHAQNVSQNVTFNDYRNRILSMLTRLEGDYNPDVIDELESLVDGAFQTLPDESDDYINQNLYDAVKQEIPKYHEFQDATSRKILIDRLDAFIDQVQIKKITAEIVATPKDGPAPLSVTLEAREVRDESKNAIPDTNYTWWIKNGQSKQVLGRGKAVNHTFTEEGAFSVFLTIDSVSRNSKGFTDVISFEESVEIDVKPERAQVFMYVNNYDVSRTDELKVSSVEAANGLIFDATATSVNRSLTIEKTSWDFGNRNDIEYNGPPRIEVQEYEPGRYKVEMTIETNQGDKIIKDFLLIVGDPLADIQVAKETGYVNEEFTFRARNDSANPNASFFWEVRDPQTGDILHSQEGPRMKFSFPHTGGYQVLLRSQNPDGTPPDVDSVNIFIESRAPVSHFDADPVSGSKPNTYVFDATGSYDPDVFDEANLTYSWFVDGSAVNLENESRGGALGEHTFTEKGTYHVELQVSDTEGKISTSQKKIDIKNLLSIEVRTQPEIAKRGEKVRFFVDAPEAVVYEWDFGDDKTDIVQQSHTSHQYARSGSYEVVLEVQAQDGSKNKINFPVHVIDSDQPFAFVEVNFRGAEIFPKSNQCFGKNAYVVNRTEAVMFDGSGSVDSSGKQQDLTYFWEIGHNKKSTSSTLKQGFDELGCFPVSLTVTSKKTGKTHSFDTYIKVENVLPRFSDLQVNIENLDADPLVVNLVASGAEDPDGAIISYTWYYFTEVDRDAQGFRVTNVPSAFFTLPKINGRYHFAVILEDSNGAKVNSNEVSEQLYSTPDLFVRGTVATPNVSLEVSGNEVILGEKSSFTADASNFIGDDITKNAEFRWDFDGDGIYDKKTDGVSQVEHTYLIPGTYDMKVKVTHRGVSATRYQRIEVTNKLKPDFTFVTIGEKLIAFNTTTGVYRSVVWKADDEIISDNKEYLVINFDRDNLPENIILEVSDGRQKQEVSYAFKSNPRNKIALRKHEKELVVITNQTLNGDGIDFEKRSISLDNPQDQLFIYLGTSRGDIAEYRIDTDIEVDSTQTGGLDDDVDNRGTASVSTGVPYKVRFDTSKRARTIRVSIHDAAGEEIASEDIEVILTYVAEPEVNPEEEDYFLSDQDALRREKLLELADKVPDSAKLEVDRYIRELTDSWHDPYESTQVILEFQQYVETHPEINGALKQNFTSVLNAILTNQENEVDDRLLARNVIENLLKKSENADQILGNADEGIEGLLNQMSPHPADYESNREIARQILTLVEADANLSDQDKLVIKDQIQKLVGTPSTDTEDPQTDEDEGGFLAGIGNFFKKFGKIFLWIGILIVAVLGLLFVIYKLRSRKEEKELTSTPSEEPKAVDSEQAPEEETSTQEETSAPENAPDWLKGDQSEAPETEATSESEEEIPAFLKEMVDESDKGPHKDLQSDTPKDEESSQESGTPEWLSGDQKEKKVDDSSEEIQEENAPDWLKAGVQEEKKDDSSEEVKEEAKEEGSEEEKVEEVPEDKKEEAPAKKASKRKRKKKSKKEAPAEKKVGEPSEEKVESQDETGDVPDWLKGESQTDAAPEEPTEEKVEEVQEDKKEEVPVEQAEKKEEVKEETPTEEIKEESKSEEESPKEESPESDIPAWLTGDSEPAVSESSEPKEESKPQEETPEESQPKSQPEAPLEEPKEEESKEESAESDVPAWLTGDSEPTATQGDEPKEEEVVTESSEEPKEEKVEEVQEDKKEDASVEQTKKKEEIKEETPTEEIKEEPKPKEEASEDLPDWLQGDVDPEAKTQFTEELEKQEEEAKKAQQEAIDQAKKEGIEVPEESKKPEPEKEEKVEEKSPEEPQEISEEKNESLLIETKDSSATPEVTKKKEDVDSSGEDLPDWLQGDVDPEAKTQFTEELEKPEEKEEAKKEQPVESQPETSPEEPKEQESLLDQAKPQEPETAPEKQEEKPEEEAKDLNDSEEDLPDWLQGDVDPNATTQFTEELEKQEEEAKKAQQEAIDQAKKEGIEVPEENKKPEKKEDAPEGKKESLLIETKGPQKAPEEDKKAEPQKQEKASDADVPDWLTESMDFGESDN